MPAANMMESLQPPALQVPEPPGAPEGSRVWSSSSTPTLRRRRFKMRRTKNVQEPSLEAGLSRDLPGVLAPGKEFLQLPSIEITPSSDEDTPWSNCSTPSASPRRKRFLLRKWLRVSERKECSESRYVPVPPQPSSLFLPGLPTAVGEVGWGVPRAPRGTSPRIAGALRQGGRLPHVSPISPVQAGGPVTFHYTGTRGFMLRSIPLDPHSNMNSNSRSS